MPFLRLFFYTHFNMKKEKTLKIFRSEKIRRILDTVLEGGQLDKEYIRAIGIMAGFAINIIDGIEVDGNDR